MPIKEGIRMIKTPTTTTLLSEETELFLENLSQITNQLSAFVLAHTKSYVNDLR